MGCSSWSGDTLSNGFSFSLSFAFIDLLPFFILSPSRSRLLFLFSFTISPALRTTAHFFFQETSSQNYPHLNLLICCPAPLLVQHPIHTNITMWVWGVEPLPLQCKYGAGQQNSLITRWKVRVMCLKMYGK